MSLKTRDFRGLFQRFGRAYRLDPRLLEAVAMTESGGNPKAFRYEPLKHDGSFGLMQVMGRTARALGLPETVRDAALCDPEIGVLYGTKVLAENLNRFSDLAQHERLNGVYETLTRPLPFTIQVALARYNGGGNGNPGPDGKTLRNQDYVNKVAVFFSLVVSETG